MKNSLVKDSARLLLIYGVMVLIFAVFLYPVITITKDNLSKWLPIYSIVLFLIMFQLFYRELWMAAVADKRKQTPKAAYPFKGFVLGILGFLPFILLALVYPLISTPEAWAANLKRIILHTLLGPEFFIIKWGGKTVLAYAVAVAAVPLMCGLSYLAGFYGIQLRRLAKKGTDIKGKGSPSFKKSPWNPTVSSLPKTKKK